jgi:hypothetical protein
VRDEIEHVVEGTEVDEVLAVIVDHLVSAL